MRQIDKIIKRVAEKNNIDPRIVDQMFYYECKSIENNLKEGKEILIRYFGTFKHKKCVRYRIKNGDSVNQIIEDYANKRKTYLSRLEESDMERQES